MQQYVQEDKRTENRTLNQLRWIDIFYLGV